MARQLRGKLAAWCSRSFHHGETHNIIHFEYFSHWLNEFRKNNSNVNSFRDNHKSASLEEHEMRKNHPTCEKSLDTPLQKEIEDH